MLKLPTNAGEWGFVIVLSVLFCGMAFGVIYSQVELRAIKREQAYRDTETNLHALATQVRDYQRKHGRIEETLTAMGIDEEELETRHAIFDDTFDTHGDNVVIRATLKKYGKGVLTLQFNSTTDQDADFEVSGPDE
ncbi:MAG: hypothetical protein KDB68_00460 [Planctomycetes bacterium]|nr:hypothetical protein [Planctomycetota bacterium]MCA8934651.1 hypothetical protein [Planctomycetota bacterium]